MCYVLYVQVIQEKKKMRSAKGKVEVKSSQESDSIYFGQGGWKKDNLKNLKQLM